jgi:hypothetical protein
MKSKSVTRIMCLLLAGAMLTGSLFAAPPANLHAEEASAAQDIASQLLKEVQFRAGQLTRDASTLDSYARGGISRASHVDQLTLVKDHINAIGVRLQMLQAIREDAAPWQQRAIDSVVPFAVKVAAHTEAAILHINESTKPLWHPDYTDHLRAISDRSGRVKDTVDLHLAMASTRDKLERLSERANEN